jgi:hypothetical protein
VNFRIEVRSSMETKGRRASERIELEMSIEVAGTDCLGFQFFDKTRALVISRHGGKVVLERKLVPQQEVTVRCLATGLEAAACIVGQTEKCEGSYCYGIKFLDEKDNIWDVEFPPMTDSEGAIGRVALECNGCKNREVIYLNDFELEVLEANGYLSRFCKRCRDVSLWRKSLGETPGPDVATPPPPPPVPAQLQNRRHEPRRELRVTACVRTTRFGQDLVKTRNVSHGGLCFTSPLQYVGGEAIEVALPYSPGGGNIFLPAKIAWFQLLASEGTRIYGAAYQYRKG